MKYKVSILLFAFLYLLFFFNKGIIFFDEGYILEGAKRVANGEIPYRDFHFMYTPASILLLGSAFKVFSESVLTGRIIMLLLALVGTFFTYLLTLEMSKSKFIAILACLMYLIWGPSHINFPWPVMFVIPLSIVTLFLITKSCNTNNSLLIILCGGLSFLIFLFKQNFGFPILIASIAAFILLKVNMKIFFRYVVGYSIGLLIFLLFLMSTNSLAAFLHDFYYYTFQKIVFENALSTSILPNNPLKAVIYLIPLFFIIAASINIYKSTNKKYLFIPIFLLGFYILGIRPTTDYVHLVPLYCITGMVFPFISNKKLWFTIPVYILIMGILLFGAYDSVFRNYYKWESPIIEKTHYITDNRARVYVGDKYEGVFDQVILSIKNNTKDNDTIFVYNNASMVYFLANRNNPTHYSDLTLHPLSAEKEVIGDLKKAKTKIIVTNAPLQSTNTPLMRFITQHFTPIASYSEYTVWKLSVFDSFP